MYSRARNGSFAKQRARDLFLMLASLLIMVGSTLPAMAARPVRVYEVTVRNTDSSASLQDAMRQVLVRATGRRDAGTDPALGHIVANPQKFVQAYRSAPGGGTQIVFNGPALEQEITAAGRGVWDTNRPFTIVVLNPPQTGAAADSARKALESIAETRGLPVSLVPMAVTDSTGAELSRDAILQAAQRLGGDAVLVGRGANAALNGQWQWTLYSSFSNQSFSGGLDAGINGAVDALARVQSETATMGEAEAVVRVSDVKTLTDYATVGRLLESAPGVRRSTLEETDGTTVTYRVLVRGGAEALNQALSGSGRLVAAGEAGTGLVYQLRP